jgi:hypothetical protein
VALATDDDVVAGPGQNPQRDLVGHRPARQPERGIFPEQLGDDLLQAVGRRVLAVLVVAHRRRGHRRAHGLRRARDGVGTQVDTVLSGHLLPPAQA